MPWVSIPSLDARENVRAQRRQEVSRSPVETTEETIVRQHWAVVPRLRLAECVQLG